MTAQRKRCDEALPEPTPDPPAPQPAPGFGLTPEGADAYLAHLVARRERPDPEVERLLAQTRRPPGRCLDCGDDECECVLSDPHAYWGTP